MTADAKTGREAAGAHETGSELHAGVPAERPRVLLFFDYA